MSSTIKYGTVGFFAIPDAGVWVPLYDKGKSVTMVLFKKGMRTDYPMFKEWFV